MLKIGNKKITSHPEKFKIKLVNNLTTELTIIDQINHEL